MTDGPDTRALSERGIWTNTVTPAVEVEQAFTEPAEQPFDAAEVPLAFREAFGNMTTTFAELCGASLARRRLPGTTRTV